MKFHGFIVACALAACIGNCLGNSAMAEDARKPADSPTEKNPAAGHSMHGEAFNEGPRQAAYRMPGMAAIRFPITSTSDHARRFFEQGVCQLHGFWHFEAERSFRQAAKLDPKCAMAYWGMSLANGENEKRARGFIATAVKLKPHVTAREAAWIDAFDRFYKEKQDDKERRRKLVRDLEAIIADHPDEIEAKAFIAWLIWANSQKGIAISSHLAADALLAEVLSAQPMHPGAHHYRVHLWDNEKAERALDSSALIGQSAPGIAHQWHMAGHIYSKLKRFDDSSWQQEASARVDHAYMMRDRVMPYQIHNYSHNNQWLATDLAHRGRVVAALEVARNLVDAPRHPEKNKITKSGHCARMGRDRLLDILPRYELWSEAIALAEANVIEPTDEKSEQIKRLKLLATASYALGNLDQGDKWRAELERLANKPENKPKPKDAKPAVDKPNEKAGAATPSANAKKAKSAIKSSKLIVVANGQNLPAAGKAANAPAAKPAEKKKSTDDEELAAWRLYSEKKYQLAFDGLEKSGARKTHRAQIALLAGQNAKAEELARQAVETGKNEFDALANLVAILHRVGKKSEAKEKFALLRELGRDADLALPCNKRIAPIAAEFGLPVDWRKKLPPKDDVGVRPLLDSLGPLTWRPVPAPTWQLVDGNGKALGSTTYRGRPVVLIFFLGAGCLHCVQQLEAFAPISADFEKAGVSILAISTDSSDAVKRQLADAAKGKPIPFRVVSNDSLHVFKQFRAYDDFESKPLHATILLDAVGAIRWQDISFEPFADPKFLLAEAKRLLSQPPSIDTTTAQKR